MNSISIPVEIEYHGENPINKYILKNFGDKKRIELADSVVFEYQYTYFRKTFGFPNIDYFLVIVQEHFFEITSIAIALAKFIYDAVNSKKQQNNCNITIRIYNIKITNICSMNMDELKTLIEEILKQQNK